MPDVEIPHWDAEKIRAQLPLAAVIAAMRDAFLALSDGRAQAPQRHSLPLLHAPARMLVMPSYMQGSRIACVKIVSICPQNAALGKATIVGSLQAFDASTGEMLATFDAETITALRTGAASALATDLLAPASASRLAIFGCGAQAMSQVEAIHQVRPLSALAVFGRDVERVKTFCRQWTTRLSIPVLVGNAASLKQADLIATATTSATPLFSRDDIAARVHINAIGSYTPDRYELPLDMLADATVVVDSRAASGVEAGEIVQALQQGFIPALQSLPELGELLARTSVDKKSVTVFKSVGHAIQDLMCVRTLLGDA